MRRRALTAGLSLAVASIGIPPGVGATMPGGKVPSHHTYIVVLKGDAPRPTRVAHGLDGVRLGHVYHSALNGFSAELTPQAVDALRAHPAVSYVERDITGHADGRRLPTGVRRIKAAANSKLKVGDGTDQRVDVDVAILDTGIARNHPDLNVVHRVNCSGVPRCVDNAGTDANGHGSNVAGIVGELDNKIGYTGVAPGARLWAIRTLNDAGEGSSSELIAGLDWVTAHAKTIEVANMSAGYDDTSHAIKDAINRAISKGIVVVVSAGNDKRDVKHQTPANVPDAVTVSALSDADGKSGGKGTYDWCNKKNKNTDDTLWIDHIRGGGSNFGRGIDIAAPGDCIQATGKNSGYSNYSGTSQAAPHVAGAAAWLAAAHNPRNRADVLAIRNRLVKAGNRAWTDTSKDGVKEPLLDLHSPKIFTGAGLKRRG
ncbi:S8 family serine peptidase [Streptomyces sp. NPDC005271]|uniref:S8 family peptidase n=1 Tax=unclassified Streptomyces TaxID=2593676 RepID=UPI00339F2986